VPGGWPVIERLGPDFWLLEEDIFGGRWQE